MSEVPSQVVSLESQDKLKSGRTVVYSFSTEEKPRLREAPCSRII